MLKTIVVTIDEESCEKSQEARKKAMEDIEKEERPLFDLIE